MKIYIQFVFFCCLLNGLNAQTITIGTGTNLNQHLPIEPFYDYSFTQSIYTAATIGKEGDIIALAYYFQGVTLLPESQDITIYMGHTTKNKFNNTDDWVPVANLTPVYTGGIDVSGGNGWKSIVLDTPFMYNGVGNLLIAFDENMPDYDNDNDHFRCHGKNVNRSIYYYADGVNSNPNPSSLPTAIGIAKFIPNIQLEFACEFPVGTASYDCTTDEITLAITEIGSVDYTAQLDEMGTGQTINAVGDYVFSSLNSDETYNIFLDDGIACLDTFLYIYSDCYSLGVDCTSMWSAGDFESGDSNWNENGVFDGGANVNIANTLIVPTTPLAGAKSAHFGGFGGTNPVNAVPPFTSILEESFFGASGKGYHLSFWMLVESCDGATDSFEVEVDGTVVYTLTGGATICGEQKWKKVALNLTAYGDGGIHIVTFKLVENGANGGATSLFIDEIVLEECPPIICPDAYLIPQVVNPGSPAYNGGFVSTGVWDFETDGTIVSIQKITAGEIADYDSATSIELGPLNGTTLGFEVELGATFHAFIDGCNGTGGTVNPLGEDNAAALSVDGEQSTVVKVEKKDLDKK